MLDTVQELTEKFTPKKSNSVLLSESYKRIGKLSKSQRVIGCGTVLDFAYEISVDGTVSEHGKLHNANFCRDRLCPMCSWRRSYKIFAQVSKIMEVIGSKYKFLFLTLTVPNCAPDQLPSALDELLKSWNRMTRYKEYKSVVRGYFRALEITRNKETGYYHPHFHVVLAVPLSYGKSLYISQARWLDMWRRACRNPAITQVDIRLMKPKRNNESLSDVERLSSAVAESAKYAVKDSDYIIPEKPTLTDTIVSELSDALYHRRLVAYGGVFDEVFKLLALDDPEDGDLVHLDDDTISPELSYLIVRYGWSAGVYRVTDSFVETARKGEKK